MILKPEKVFKRYDIRGKYPEELDEEFAKRLGKSLGTFIGRNFGEKVVVGKDNKKSSEGLKKALVSGLKSTGVDVIDVGTGSADFTAWSGTQKECVSVEVTSSHMPLDFNGFKFMYPEGNGFVNEDLYAVQDLFRDEDFEAGTGSVIEAPELKERYREKVVEFASEFQEDNGREIVVDSLGGTGKILPELVKDLGHEVIDISEEERPYVDPPSPEPEALNNLKQRVKSENAYMGVSNDLDADRITVCYDGRFLTGDEIFSILAQIVEDPVVASIDTSQALEDLASVEHTRVGDPFVMDKATDIGAKLAGEPNGHYSLTEFVPYNSGMLTALILSGLDMGEKLDNIPDYTVERESIQVDDKHEIIEKLKSEFNDEIISELDGVKFSYGDAELLVRPSGSSPKVRVISESRSAGATEKALNIVIGKIESF